jgi:hypothetical protein
MIFIILGVMLVNEYDFWKHWNTAFSFLALFFVIAVRFLGIFNCFYLFVYLKNIFHFISVTFALTFFVNRYTEGVRKVSFQEQLIMVK